MKLLFFASDYNIGLSSLLTDELVALHRNGISLTAIAGDCEQEIGLTERIKDIPHYRIKGLDIHSNFKKLANTIREIIESDNISVVHVQNNWQLALIVYVKYVLCKRVKILYTLHAFRHNSPFKSIIAQVLIGTALLFFVDHIICMCSYLKKKFKLLSYKITLLPLGISDSYFENAYSPCRTDGLHLVFPAQFRYGKNQDMLIKAFAEYIRRSEDEISTLTLPGSGELLDNMKSLAVNLGITDRVYFPGQCKKIEIKNYYQNCNIGIVSSNSETFGQSIVEPYVLGRCVLSRKVGIAPDIIQNRYNGFLYDNQSDLVAILMWLSKDTSLINIMGKHNFKDRFQFHWDIISKKYQDIL